MARLIWSALAVGAVIGWVSSHPGSADPTSRDLPVDKTITAGEDVLPLDQGKIDAIQSVPTPASLPAPQSAPTDARSVPRSPPPAPVEVFVTGSVVNIRAGPGTTHPVVWKARAGTKLFLQNQSGDWSQVSGNSPNGPISGWIASRYLSATRPATQPVAATQPARQVAVPTTRELNAARADIIRQSIAAYPGTCACPYNRDSAGRRCGGRSAWSKPGGYSPICYDSDISAARLESYLARRR